MFAGIKILTDRYAKMHNITKVEAERRIKEFAEVLREELLDEDSDGIQLIDFITLKKVERKPKLGRNPKAPEKTYEIPASIGIKCELGKSFNEELNG